MGRKGMAVEEDEDDTDEYDNATYNTWRQPTCEKGDDHRQQVISDHANKKRGRAGSTDM